ncbi:MAG: hypothetical protein ACT6T3_22295, partial [Agrobacterium sp.]|uniref:hypothetical protein n=1 Tax=Agrobacterium sp. TaxID=361 RepID=UPI004033E0CC
MQHDTITIINDIIVIIIIIVVMIIMIMSHYKCGITVKHGVGATRRVCQGYALECGFVTCTIVQHGVVM